MSVMKITGLVVLLLSGTQVRGSNVPTFEAAFIPTSLQAVGWVERSVTHHPSLRRPFLDAQLL
ncbi:hypothetical protein [Dehalogenimonas etheniformans]|nr:hypothetical protein [Dehalogenimonas etheniformans]QNT76114.1 hypothetical protein HX448_05110 [Dehalogenimonas etheniformans]